MQLSFRAAASRLAIVVVAGLLAGGEDVALGDTRGGMLKVRSGPVYVYTPGYSYNVTTWHKTGTIAMYHSRIGAMTREQAYSLHAQTVADMLKGFVASGGKEPGPSRKEVIDAAISLAPVPAGATPR